MAQIIDVANKVMHEIYYNHEASNCSDPTFLLNLRKITFQFGSDPNAVFSEGVTISLVCQSGYFWQDEINVKVMKCESNLTWSGIPDPCSGNYTISYSS